MLPLPPWYAVPSQHERIRQVPLFDTAVCLFLGVMDERLSTHIGGIDQNHPRTKGRTKGEYR